MDRYETDLDSIVLPALGELRLGEIAVGVADRFLKALGRRKPGRVKTSKVVLSHVMGLATRHDAIPTNPVRQVGEATVVPTWHHRGERIPILRHRQFCGTVSVLLG